MSRQTMAVESFYNTLAAGDLPGVLDQLRDVVWFEAAGTPYAADQPYQGAAEVAERVLGPITAAVPDLAVTLERLIDLGQTVAAHGTYSGTPAGGVPLQVGFVHIWRVNDDRLATFHQFTDVAQFTALTADHATP